MSGHSRRTFMIGAGATAVLAGCGNGVGSRGSQKIDGRVESARDYMYNNVPGAQDLAYKAAGVLIMPLITEAGFWVGGSYGRGALQVNDSTVDYYSATQATFGLQIGAQQYAHALFFMTEESLSDFRRSAGWAAGADIQYALKSQGANLGADTFEIRKPVVALVFGQAGLIIGATVEGTKYTRIIP